MMPRPREVSERLGDVSARTAGDWLRGDREPSATAIDRMLRAFPHLDGRWFVAELARRRAAKRAGGG